MIYKYKTLAKRTDEVLFKDRSSKFFGYGFALKSEEDINDFLNEIKAQHPQARHHCYAYSIGIDSITTKANDDGEPSNTAGMPILNQIKSQDLQNVMIVVVRYFGGTKLGVSGLINAYKSTAKMVLDNAKIVTVERQVSAEIHCNYQQLSSVYHFLNTFPSNITDQKLEQDCRIMVEFPLEKKEQVQEFFNKQAYAIHWENR